MRSQKGSEREEEHTKDFIELGFGIQISEEFLKDYTEFELMAIHCSLIAILMSVKGAHYVQVVKIYRQNAFLLPVYDEQSTCASPASAFITLEP